MFDENFSFGCSSSNIADPLPASPYEYGYITTTAASSADVSPFTSRSSSPRLVATHPGRRRSSTHLLSRRDSRLNGLLQSYPRHPSITALTAQLESQSFLLNEPASPPFPSATFSSDGTATFSDEACYADSPLTSLSPFDLLPNVTSSPSSSISSSSPTGVGASLLRTFALRRRQRQSLVRLQCLARRGPEELMMLVEECHPSSLPFGGGAAADDDDALDLPWPVAAAAAATSVSVARARKHRTNTSISPGRVEKESFSPALSSSTIAATGTVTISRKPRMRKRATR